MRFIGNIEAKTDSKGRVFLPACFRRILQAGGCDKVRLRKDVYQDCLVLYPEKSWNEQLDLLRSRLDRWNAAHQMIFRQFVADVEELKAGNNEFREAAGQTRKALEAYELPEVAYFLETFMDSFSLTLDELK